jgi:ribonuclease E
MPPHAEPGADQPDLPPVYTGPTPANPFGGQNFDIFDVLEQAEAAAPAQTIPLAAPEPVPSIILEEPEPLQSEALRSEAELEFMTSEPERAPVPSVILTELEPAQTETMGGEPEPESVVAANDAAPEPAVKPIIIGAEPDAVVEKKRGWWRR